MRSSGAGKAASVASDGWARSRSGDRDAESNSERPVDLVHLARQTFGDKRLETELLRLFMRQAEQILASLEGRQMEQLDRQSAGDLLHMLLGSARAVGATSVAALAQRLEAEQRSAEAHRDVPADPDWTQLHDAIVQTNGFIAELLQPA